MHYSHSVLKQSWLQIYLTFGFYLKYNFRDAGEMVEKTYFQIKSSDK